MNIAELLPTLRSLSRANKLKFRQFLVLELAKEEDILLLEPGEYGKS